MKHISILFLSIVLFSCSGEQTQDDNRNISEVINELEEIHPYNLSPDKSWMIDLTYENKFLKSYTITHQGGEENTVYIDSMLSDKELISPPKKNEYSWVQDKDLGAGFKISSIGLTKQELIELVIFKEGFGLYTFYEVDKQK